ncbi:MAG TPA: glutaminyl-peptide cyclotransferase [Thermoanaerobaculia bacterium]|jgi:glutaminyl-peptide cyclotransferase
MRRAVPAVLTFMVAAQASAQISAERWKAVKQWSVKVLAEHPHDRRAFTQGLVWHDGLLYESTGQHGWSSVRRVEPATGAVLAQYDLDRSLFGEGLALASGRLIQLTWQTGLALVYDAASLAPVDQFVYQGEGWGLAWDGRRLAMSDGTSRLTFRDPETFDVLETREVTLDGLPLANLNELEHADGLLYANVWLEDRIVAIDPETGKVRAVIDASGLLSPLERRGVDALNGIAYDPVSETFWITGKYWPWMFQVVFVPEKSLP